MDDGTKQMKRMGLSVERFSDIYLVDEYLWSLMEKILRLTNKEHHVVWSKVLEIKFPYYLHVVGMGLWPYLLWSFINWIDNSSLVPLEHFILLAFVIFFLLTFSEILHVFGLLLLNNFL